MNTTDLLKDKVFVAEMLNGPCRPKGEKENIAPINLDWIDLERSEQVTEAFRQLLPDGIPYYTSIIVERNPDAQNEGASVDDNEKRMRYFVVTVIPDTEYPYDISFPLIHQMWTLSLHCWEVTRATLDAAANAMRVLISNDPVPPILNNARLSWVSLYLGRKPYHGIIKLSEQWNNAEDFDGLEHDVNLYKVREMEITPMLQKLLDAYEADFPEANHEE